MHRRVRTLTIRRCPGFYLWHQWSTDRRVPPGLRYSPASPGYAAPTIAPGRGA